MMHALWGAPAPIRRMGAVASCSPRRRSRARSRSAQGYAAQWLMRVDAGRAHAQLHRHGRVPAGHARRDLPPRAPVRERPGVGEAPEPRRSRARDRALGHRGALLLSRREGRAHRAAHVPQRVPVAVARADQQPRAVLRVQARRRAGASPAASPRSPCSSRATACATAHRFWADADHRAAPARSRLVNEKGEVDRGVRVHRRHGQREDRQGHGEAVVDVGAARLASQAGGPRRRRDATTPAGPSARCRPASSRSWKASARCAASASRWRTSCFPTASSPISVFVEPYTVTQTQIGLTQAGGLAQYSARAATRFA